MGVGVGSDKTTSGIVNNSKVHVFGLLLGRESNKCIVQGLSEGIKNCVMFDDPKYKIKEIL